MTTRALKKCFSTARPIQWAETCNQICRDQDSVWNSNAQTQKISAYLHVVRVRDQLNKSLFHRRFCAFTIVRVLLFHAATNCLIASLRVRASCTRGRRMHAVYTVL